MINDQKPKQYDAVLGCQSQELEGAAVLGGIEGVRLRLSNPDPKVRIAALKQAVNYGEQGLELVIEALKYDYSWDVQDAAYLLLKPLLLIPFPRYRERQRAGGRRHSGILAPVLCP